jgi:NOL1/NOP2/fmu family ribosome biogenesis protein
LVTEGDRHHLFSYLERRFGIPETLFNDYLLFKRKKSWRLLRYAPQVPYISQLKVSKMGLKAFQKVGSFVKPSTRMIQIFGTAATKARLELDTGQLLKLLDGEELPINLDLDSGYVILALSENRILGVGFYINGTVRSQIPRKQLKRFFDKSDGTGQEVNHVDKNTDGEVLGCTIVGLEDRKKGEF